jgi:DNA-binding beta-propeller fold protein YncE
MKAIQVLRLCVLAVALSPASFGSGFFGKVVPIGGHASDIALDEGRGVLYIANYTANRIEVMNLSDQSIGTSINVPFPGSLSLSRDGKYLVVATYANFQGVSGQATNVLTIIALDSGTRRTVPVNAPPLAVAFGADGLALALTTTEFLLVDPASAAVVTLDSIAAVLANAKGWNSFPSWPVSTHRGFGLPEKMSSSTVITSDAPPVVLLGQLNLRGVLRGRIQIRRI